MSKSPWEARVGHLLDGRLHPEFKYAFKPYDSGHYGGQPRIDWHAADLTGRYWMLEVKALAENRRSINLDSEVTSGQREGLTAIAQTSLGVPILAIGQETMLYLFDWRIVQHLYDGGARPLLALTQATLSIPWGGVKAWRLVNLFDLWKTTGVLPQPFLPAALIGPGSTTPIPPPFGLLLPPTQAPPSPSISKQPASIRTRRRKLLSGPSLSRPQE